MSKFDDLVKKRKEIFQIDRPELDFGVYRILHARVGEITRGLGGYGKIFRQTLYRVVGVKNRITHLCQQFGQCWLRGQSVAGKVYQRGADLLTC